MAAPRLKIRLRHGLPGADLAMDLEVEAMAIAAIGGDAGTRACLLDLIAGFERPREGLVRIDDTTLTDTSTRIRVSVRRRRVAWIPAGGGLFPHLTIGENLAFAVHRLTAEGRERYRSTVAAFDLSAVLPLRPDRIDLRETLFAATARALIATPRLILMEEPLTALDPVHALDDLEDLLERTGDAGVPVVLTAPAETPLPAGLSLVHCTQGGRGPGE